MLGELKNARKVVGIKQLRKILTAERLTKVFLADNADPALLQPIEEQCLRQQIPVERVPTMEQLGEACRIAVGAAAAGILRD